MILEEIDRVAAYTYRIRLRRVFKSGDRLINVQVTNNPEDQSEEAGVFCFLDAPVKDRQPLEQHLAMVAVKRVYDVTEETWPRRHFSAAGTKRG